MGPEHAHSGALCVTWVSSVFQIQQDFELRDVAQVDVSLEDRILSAGAIFQGNHLKVHRISMYVRRYNSSAPSIAEG